MDKVNRFLTFPAIYSVHRAAAACLAISERLLAESFSARVLPPFISPNVSRHSCYSHRITLTAAPAGRVVMGGTSTSPFATARHTLLKIDNLDLINGQTRSQIFKIIPVQCQQGFRPGLERGLGVKKVVNAPASHAQKFGFLFRL
jgi:hypothetical protein